MKKAFLLIAVAAFSFALPSCKKCTTCEYTYEVGGVSQKYTYPETCGKKADLDAIEASCKSAASAYTGATCTCSKS